MDELKENLKTLLRKAITNAKDGDEKGQWITVKGTHVFIPEGKTAEDVIKEKGWKEKGEGKEKSEGNENKHGFKKDKDSGYYMKDLSDGTSVYVEKKESGQGEKEPFYLEATHFDKDGKEIAKKQYHYDSMDGMFSKIEKDFVSKDTPSEGKRNEKVKDVADITLSRYLIWSGGPSYSEITKMFEDVSYNSDSIKKKLNEISSREEIKSHPTWELVSETDKNMVFVNKEGEKFSVNRKKTDIKPAKEDLKSDKLTEKQKKQTINILKKTNSRISDIVDSQRKSWDIFDPTKPYEAKIKDMGSGEYAITNLILPKSKSGFIMGGSEQTLKRITEQVKKSIETTFPALKKEFKEIGLEADISWNGNDIFIVTTDATNKNIKNGLSEIIKNSKPETKEDLKILKGLKDILEEQ